MIQKFSFEKLDLEGAYDERGYFIKDYSKEVFRENDMEHRLKEVFYTSSHRGVIRAIHF